MGKNEEIKLLNFGVRGMHRKADMYTQKYNKKAKIVKTKRKISSSLKKELLRNYGLRVEDN